jgi:hypothetical protein
LCYLCFSRFSFMADSCPRPRLAKIVLGIGCFFLVITVVCFSVGGPLYIQERNKALLYAKDSCRVRSASYETLTRCIAVDTRAMRYKKCYVPLWQVEFGQNGTLRETIRGGGEDSYRDVEAKTDQYKVCSTSSYFFTE